MLADPVKQIGPHGRSLISKSFLHVIEDIFDAQTVAEIVEDIECLVDHLSSFLSEFTYNVQEVDLGSLVEVLPQTSSHSSCDFESP